MKIGVPKEIKDHEYRVGVIPAGAHALVARGHVVVVQAGAGTRTGFPDEAYVSAGARIVAGVEEVFDADMVVKVKELQPEEYALVRSGQILFAYLHLAPDPQLLNAIIASGVSGVAYETVERNGKLPLLAPMSRIAGRLSVQFAAWALQMANGGSGVLMGGVGGVPPAKVVVIGPGEVGTNAAQIAAGMGADVMLMGLDTDHLAQLDQIYGGRIKTCYSEPLAIAEHVAAADVIVSGVLIPGKMAPKLISREVLASMRPGSVLVDVAIDQGGIAETSRPTSHSNPVYVEEGVVHYCVPNMPSAVARTATLALAHATFPYMLKLADKGLDALADDPGLAKGLQTHAGAITHRGLAEDVNQPYTAFR